jgi:hypothetical protein
LIIVQFKAVHQINCIIKGRKINSWESNNIILVQVVYMNKLQKLAQLNKDIELLEAAGKFKAAEVLQKKFVKEAQAQNNAFVGLVTQDAKNAMMQMDSAWNNGKIQLIPGILQNVANTEATPDEQQILKTHANKLMSQRMDENRSQYQGYQTPQDNIAPQGSAVATNAVSQPQGTSGDTANEMQAQNTMPAESPIYQQAINQIAKLLQTKNPMNRTIANQIYESTVVKFQDPKRKQAFARQFQAIVSRNFPGQSLKPGA